jgi:dTDP-4-amino-4,6-dideoxygalactose transaminase
LFVVRSSRRETIRNALIQNDIESGIHYPVPLHLQPVLAYLGYRLGDFPASEAFAAALILHDPSGAMEAHLKSADPQTLAECVA